MSSAVKQAEEIFDQFDVNERTEFCEYIASRFIPPAAPKKKLNHQESIAAWERIKQLGAEMDKQRAPSDPTLSEILTEMRNS